MGCQRRVFPDIAGLYEEAAAQPEGFCGGAVPVCKREGCVPLSGQTDERNGTACGEQTLRVDAGGKDLSMEGIV